MIRLTFLLRRKPGMSLDEFQRYWLNEHGPLLASHANHLAMQRCMQVWTLPDENDRFTGTRGTMESPYDGVTEIWWENMAALTDALATEAGRKAIDEIVAHERGFVDHPMSPLWFGYEYPQVNAAPETLIARERSSIVKFYYPLRHLSQLSFDDAQLYWRTQHGPVIRSQATAGRVLRYIQVHRFETPLEDAWRAARGTVTETYTGHAELWFDRSSFGPMPTDDSQRATSRAEDDERNFIDFSRSAMWFAKERVVVDRA